MRTFVVVAVAGLAACAPQQQSGGAGGASSTSSSGGTHQGTIVVGAHAIPLPPGEWRLIGRMDEAVWARRVLIQEQNERLTGLITFSVNLPTWVQTWTWDTSGIWGCHDAAGNLVPTIRNTANVMEGWNCRRITTTNMRTRNITAPVEQPLAARRAAQPDWAPERMLIASFSRGEPLGGSFVTYFFDPRAGGAPPASTEADTARIVRWAEATAPLVAGGFKTQTTAPAPAF
jgi:hypothetical protein